MVFNSCIPQTHRYIHTYIHTYIHIGSGTDSSTRRGASYIAPGNYQNTSRVSENSAQFWYCLLGDSIWSRDYEFSSSRLPPLPPPFPSDASHKPGLLPVLLTNWLQIGGSHDPFFGLQIPVTSVGCYLYFCPTSYKSGVLTMPALLGFD